MAPDFAALLLRSLYEGVVAFDADGTVRDANPRFCELTGYRLDQLAGRPPPYPWSPPREADMLAQVAATGTPIRLEQVIRRADGASLPVLVSLAPVRVADRGAVGCVAVYTDISDMRHARLESAPDAVLEVDADGHILLANPAAQRLFGYPEGDLVGRAIDLLVPDGMRARHATLRAGYAANPAHREMGGLELSGLRRDGTEFPAEISLACTQADDGIRVYAAVRDVTERKRAEAALRRQQEHTQSILATASDPFVSIDGQGIITDWNHSAERVLGWSRREAIGRELAETIVPPALRQAHRDGIARLIGGAPSRILGKRVEITALHRDGHELPVELAIWRGGTDGEERFHAFMHDITDRLELQAERESRKVEVQRQQYERRLQQSQRLESLGLLAGGVAHDFNNILAVIINYADVVAQDIEHAAAHDPRRWETSQEDMAQIRRAADRAIGLTRQLLMFGRREISQPDVISLNDVVAEVQQLLYRTLGEHIQLVTSLAEDLLPIVADPGQIEQVLVNLAVNARDAMPDGGTLIIETVNLTEAEEQEVGHPEVEATRHVRMRVCDTGTGMSRETAERAFEPFFTTKPKSAGTGLGLPTVFGIVTQAGGQAYIDSELGVGTTVTVLLPATSQLPAASAKAPKRAAAPRVGQTILVVEDEDALREVSRRILARNGYQVLTAASGVEALELVAAYEKDIDLLLTDVVMPHMLGKELATKMRAVRPDIEVLYMSGYAQPVLASQGTLDPGVALLNKPFTEAQLIEEVQEALSTAYPETDGRHAASSPP
jgi:PAS domain S-box-containing protein